MTEQSLSVVVPAYNERPRIVPTLSKIRRHLKESVQDWELIVVDDGSVDGTDTAVHELFARAGEPDNLRLLRNERNRGKGFSVRRGFLSARCDVVLFTDADLSAPIEEAEKLLAPIRAGDCDAAFGSRALDGSVIRVHQPAFREFGGRCYNRLMQLIAGLPYRDTQCGFKAFRRGPFVPVFSQQRIERFGFDPEILYLARKRGLRLSEVPVVWGHSPDTRVHFLRDSASMFLDLLRIRWNDLLGRYNHSPGTR